MTILLGIIITILVFTFIVFIHEMGHFLTARFTKMKVEEFGIGIPPKAKTLGKDKKWTEFTLNWLPIGGFVRIKWEDPGSEDARDKDSFASKKWWARSLVLIAWVSMNFLLAIIIFFWFFIAGSTPISPNTFVKNDYGSYFLPSFESSLKSGYIEHGPISFFPVSESVAWNAGIRNGDFLLSINGETLSDIEKLRSVIAEWSSMRVVLSSTGWEIKSLTLLPKDGKIWSYLSYKDLKINKLYAIKLTPIDAFWKSIHETYALSRITFDVLVSTLKKLISPANPEERKEAKEMLSWPIGIGSGFVDIVSYGITWKILFSIIALLSINLGVLNILPFPALDGGRLVSTTVRSIIGIFYHKTRVLNTVEYSFHTFGMMFLLALSLFIAYIDISKFF